MVGKTITQRQSPLFLIVSTLVIFVVGCFAFVWQITQQRSSGADNNGIVGQPSLPAADVNAIFSRAGSSMAGTGVVVEDAARRTNIDDAFALAVWWAETNDGMAGVGLGAHNPGGVKGSANYPVVGGGYTAYPSYAAAITDWFNIVKTRYVNAGRISVYTICGPYVGTATACSSAGWAGKVSSYMQRYRAMAPPPMVQLASQPVHGSGYFDLAVQSQPHATPVAGAAASQPAQRAQAGPRTVFPLGEAIGIGIALLIALAIAAWGTLMRYGVSTGLPSGDPQPLAEQFVVSGSPLAVKPPSPQKEFSSGQFEWQPPVDRIETQMHPVMPPYGAGGVLNTDTLPTQFGVQLPVRAPIQQGAPGTGGGLLRRYRSERGSSHVPGS